MSIFGKKPKTKGEAKITEAKPKKKTASIPVITEEINVAISMSLYLYLNDRHDVESDIITIKHLQHNYSPWNSRIYGLNNILK